MIYYFNFFTLITILMSISFVLHRHRQTTVDRLAAECWVILIAVLKWH